jgi:hypothetical protein
MLQCYVRAAAVNVMFGVAFTDDCCPGSGGLQMAIYNSTAQCVVFVPYK